MRCAARPSPNGNICRSQLGRREQQVGVGVDHGAIFLLRPGQQRIMRPQARLDMRDRDPGDEGSQRAAKRARRVALNDDEVRRLTQKRQKGAGHRLDMDVRVLVARAIQFDPGEGLQPELVRRQRGMLPGEDQRRDQAVRRKGIGDGFELDGFGPGADDQPDVGETQPSP